MGFKPPPDTYEPGTGLPWPDESARDHLAKHLAAEVDVDALTAALRVLNVVANAPVDELADKITDDGYGNPVTDTPQQKHAQATWSHAYDLTDRAHGWADLITQALEAKE